MKKLIIAAAVAATTLMSVNTASALSFNFDQSFWDAVAEYYGLKKGGTTANPGETFARVERQPTTAELTQLCLDLGGTPDRRFQGNDFYFYCAQ